MFFFNFVQNVTAGFMAAANGTAAGSVSWHAMLPEVIWEDHVLAMLGTPALWALLDTAKKDSNPFWASVRTRVVRHNNILLVVGAQQRPDSLAANVRALKAWTRRLALVPNVEMPPIRVVARAADVGDWEPAIVDFEGVKIVGCGNVIDNNMERVVCNSRIFVVKEDGRYGPAAGDGESKAASPSAAGSVTLENICLVNCMSEAPDADSRDRFRYSANAGIWVHGAGTLATLVNCMVLEQKVGVELAHGMQVDKGGAALCTRCEFKGNKKSGVFLRGKGSSVMLVMCRLVGNQDYGMSVERGGKATLLDGCVVSHNQWYGLGCWGKGSVITLASRDVIVAENTNDSYGSKYGYQKGGGLIQLLCD